MARIAAGRKARQRRAFLLASGAMSALVLLVASGGWVLTCYMSGSLGRVDAGTVGTPDSGPLNILMTGVDDRTGLTPHQQKVFHVGRSDGEHNTDTLMIAHIPADRRDVQVVSLPRDSWVPIPGHGMGKIDSALALGGPKLMVRTVEQDTGLTINDYVEVNFLGFVKAINALGGVNICLPFAVDDPYSGLHLSAGRHHVSGITALKFVRDRHSFALSDLARISNQQQLLSSLLKEATSSGTLANPLRLERLLSAASSAIKVDRGFNVIGLAEQLRGISLSDVTLTTVPLSNPNYTTPGGESAVLWNARAARALFHRLKTNQGALKPKRHKPTRARPRLHRGQVSVDVYNGTLITALSADTGAELARLGFRVHGAGLTWSRQNVIQTAIQYPAGQHDAARLVHKVLPGASLRAVSGLARIRIVLGVNGHAVVAHSSSGGPGGAGGGHSSGAGGASSSGHQKTAAQAACK